MVVRFFRQRLSAVAVEAVVAAAVGPRFLL
jgi:hypothetical protein